MGISKNTSIEYFPSIKKVKFQGNFYKDRTYGFQYYDSEKIILGKPMKEHLKISACYWHNFVWSGSDAFGDPTIKHPWNVGKNPMDVAINKANAAFEFFNKLGINYYTFHDIDVAPEGENICDFRYNFYKMVDVLEKKQEETGIKLLWGTSNCFSNPRFSSGASTNPDPRLFTYSAAQVFSAMSATKRLGGKNYVLWGGREGYETLLNTDLKKERKQLGRFMQMVVEYKHKINFKGDILIEPKPQEPTKHQYDYDSSTVYGFLKEYNLEKEIKLNIEANHATLSGHSFHHEISNASSLGILGSIDANRGDTQSGWDTDQFPNSVEEMSIITYEILKNGGFGNGGYNFDSKLRRQSIDQLDLFYAHISAIDVLALSLEIAQKMILKDILKLIKKKRYKNWDSKIGSDILCNKINMKNLFDISILYNRSPLMSSGKQELLEMILNNFIYDKKKKLC